MTERVARYAAEVMARMGLALDKPYLVVQYRFGPDWCNQNQDGGLAYGLSYIREQLKALAGSHHAHLPVRSCRDRDTQLHELASPKEIARTDCG